MRVRILAVGTRMPEWVTTAYEDYARRMRKDMRVDLEEIPVVRIERIVDFLAANSSALSP